ncbi:GTPase ObgE [candidate division KSB1 bacterium]|nr:GTPase ObgE [candidate division KSB1 bacterium]
MFIDQAKITVESGKGGNGCLSFRREKYVPKGGPDGGDGGKGGDVIFRVDTHLATLLDFRYKRKYKAGNGSHGQGAKKTGKNGADCIIRVPQGTIIKDADTGEILADLVDADQEVLVAKGGKGGRGNARYATPTNQAPRYFEYGGESQFFNLFLELKLIADVGLVGFPNAGKSTLLSKISAAHPKIADYPFTTLAPNLGIVKYKDDKTFVVADIPGIIEGAHVGKGLGIQFIKHIERTRVIVYLIEAISPDISGDLNTLKNELKSYNPRLLKKKFFVMITKIDLLPGSTEKDLKQLFKNKDEYCLISAMTGDGLETAKEMMWNFLNNE